MSLIEKRYAQALVEVSIKEGAVADYQSDFSTLTELYETDGGFRSFLLSPQINSSSKKGLLRDALGDRIKENLLGFLLLLLDKGRIRLLPGIFKEFVSIADKKRKNLVIRIYSARPLDPVQIESIRKTYLKKYGALSAKMETYIDEKLLGGVKVVIGDTVIDSSVNGRLKNLNRMITQN